RTVSIIRAPQGPQREAGLAKMRQAFDTLKARGWSEEKKEYANAKCIVLMPPESQNDMLASTGCFAEVKGMGLSFGAMGKKRVSIESVKALLDKAMGRVAP